MKFLKNQTTQMTGQTAEEWALNYLLKQGLVCLEQNFYSKLGEIDLIMRSGEDIVFVEVRYRRSPAYGHAFETVTLSKQKKIIKTAQYYLMQKKWYDKYPVRFDVLGLEGSPPEVNWVKHAFY